MVKYLVGCDDVIEVIVNTKADAEEYVLSLAEEEAYENYLTEVYYYYKDLKSFSEEWTEQMIATNDYRKQYPFPIRSFSTLYGFLLNYHGEYYHITEASALE